jgi:hypothetical protein
MIFDVIIEESVKVLSRFNATTIDQHSFRLQGHAQPYRHRYIRIDLDDTTLSIKTADGDGTQLTTGYKLAWSTDITHPSSITEFINNLNEVCLTLLPEYSCSNPTGPKIGRMWKRNLTAYSGKKQPPHWIICEATEDPDPDYVRIETRELYEA